VEHTARTLIPHTQPLLSGKERTLFLILLVWGLAKFKLQEPTSPEFKPQVPGRMTIGSEVAINRRLAASRPELVKQRQELPLAEWEDWKRQERRKLLASPWGHTSAHLISQENHHNQRELLHKAKGNRSSGEEKSSCQ
jgi:hypothetical protein